MSNVYFELKENFEPIIKNCLQNKEIENMKQITTGWTNIVYEVETKNEGEYIFRFPRDEFWSRTIVKDCEFAGYIYKKTEYNTCNLKLKEDNGRPFSMHKKIKGMPLAEKIEDLSEQELQDIAEDISKFMNELHNIEFQEGKVFNIDNIGLNLREFLDELLKKHVAKSDMDFWNLENNSIGQKCLVHGDLNLSNVLLDENNKVTAIIDFGFAGFGNAYDDIARILSRTCPKAFRKSIIENYEKCANIKIDEKKLDDKIEEWKNIDQSYINYMKSIGIVS